MHNNNGESHPKVDLKMHCQVEELRPKYQSSLASGFDLCAAKATKILSGERVLIPTGVRVQIPAGYELQIRPRSGLAYKQGLTVLNAPGTIDSDYRAEIGVILYNTSQHQFEISIGDRVAQAVLCPIVQADLFFVEDPSDLSVTVRGEGGFGSTGVR